MQRGLRHDTVPESPPVRVRESTYWKTRGCGDAAAGAWQRSAFRAGCGCCQNTFEAGARIGAAASAARLAQAFDLDLQPHPVGHKRQAEGGAEITAFELGFEVAAADFTG